MFFAALQGVALGDGSLFMPQPPPEEPKERTIDDVYHGVKENFVEPKDGTSSAADVFSGRMLPKEDILDVLNKPRDVVPGDSEPEPKIKSKADADNAQPEEDEPRQVQTVVAACGAWAIAVVGLFLRKK
ncbi:MAG: hypothetical protein IJT09_05525 [Abditibacteriota bacterium]|nr:hypothetical protein [Abditibacteriota bacterium]